MHMKPLFMCHNLIEASSYQDLLEFSV